MNTTMGVEIYKHIIDAELEFTTSKKELLQKIEAALAEMPNDVIGGTVVMRGLVTVSRQCLDELPEQSQDVRADLESSQFQHDHNNE
jgi:hypothetical protein